MPEITRSQLAVYAAIAVVIAVLGARALRGAGVASAGDRQTGAAFAGSGSPAGTQTGAGAARAGGEPGEQQVVVGESGPAAAVVHVAGAVHHPGVYRLRAGARVRDAVRRAGGPSRDADRDAVNLAAKVADGQQVLIPRRAPAAAPVAPATAGSGTAGPAAPAAPVSLGSATAEQLETLDGVGPATAQKIIAWRTEHGGFRSIDDLGEVPGIGPKRLAALRPRVQP